MDKVLKECKRVLKKRGKAIYVIGDSMIHGIFIKNSEGLLYLALQNGLKLVSKSSRVLPANRRYLPPPNSRMSGRQMQSRMKEEVVFSFEK